MKRYLYIFLRLFSFCVLFQLFIIYGVSSAYSYEDFQDKLGILVDEGVFKQAMYDYFNDNWR